MAGKRRFFRYSNWDALPALAGVANVAFLFWALFAFPSLPAWAIVVSFAAVVGFYTWNLQCISHNFIHNPYFQSRWLNRLFGVLETFCIGLPHQLYHHYHLNHHWGDNDARGPDGTTRDWSSIYRYGKGQQAESFWRYCLISFFRVELTPVLRVAIRHGQENVLQVIAETVALVVMWAVMALVSWKYFLFFYLPSYYLGWVISYAEGYLEHYGAQPGNPYANSVSSYHWLYNLTWFNNGYHQEHHWDPKMHWTRMHELHERIKPHLDANHTRVLRGPHITGFLEDFMTTRTQSSAAPREEKRRAA